MDLRIGQIHRGRCDVTSIGVRGGGLGAAAAPPGLKNFQGKLCFQGNRKFLKNPES